MSARDVALPPTIPEALFAAAERDGGELVFHLDEGTRRLSYPELAERAQTAAGRLVALGIEPGDAVGLLGPNRPEWAVWAFGAWIAGAVLVPIQIPLRVRDPDAFRAQLRSLVDAGGCKRVMADPRLAGLLSEEVAVVWEEGGEESAAAPVPFGPERDAVIQFTSGSTAAPKGALLSHAAAIAQAEILRAVGERDDGRARTMVGWGPFFHDLGLMAYLVAPIFIGATVHELPTERFARDPAEWLRLIDVHRGELTVAPSSAFGAALKAVGRSGESIDLGSLEAAYFAAEGVDPEVVREMVESAQKLGFRPEALGSSYGLAEVVMAVAHTPVGAGLGIDRVSLDRLTGNAVAEPVEDGPARLMVSCGHPRMELRIAGTNGDLPDRHVGEIQVRGPSLMKRYVGPGAPEDPFVDGWLRTGDLGYMADGELYVAGRAKDVMIVTGHNYYPEDFEWAAARVDGIRPGRCAAFAPPGCEGVTLLIEPADPSADPTELKRQVRRAVADAIGIGPTQVIIAPRGSIEKTTSGKLRRAAMRQAHGAGAAGVRASTPTPPSRT
jgi:acyl-CoA synthetase (AMP-forming)/AMP-acid ligase II